MAIRRLRLSAEGFNGMDNPEGSVSHIQSSLARFFSVRSTATGEPSSYKRFDAQEPLPHVNKSAIRDHPEGT